MANAIDSEWEDVGQDSEWENIPNPEIPTPSPKNEPSWSEVPGKFIGGAFNTAKSIYDLGMKSPEELGDIFRNPETNPVWQALPHPTVNESTGNVGFDPGAVYKQAKNIITSPVQTFKREPFETTMALAPILSPAARLAGRVTGATEALGGVKSLFGSAARKGLSYAGDIPEESIGYRMANPQAVKSASTIDVLSTQRVPEVANRFDRIIGELGLEGKKTLSKSNYLQEGAFTKDEVLKAVSSARRELGGVYTSEGEMASKALGRLGQNLKKIRETVSQNQIHDLIQDLDREIPWKKVWRSPETLTLEDTSLMNVRTRLDDLLKKKNPSYSKVMEPLSDVINTRNEYLKNFALDKIKGQGYVPSNTTPGRLFGATNENRVATQRILGKTRELTGEQLSPQVKAAQVKADFAPESGKSFKGNDVGLRQIFGRPAVEKIVDYIGEYNPKIPNISNKAPLLNIPAKWTPEKEKRLQELRKKLKSGTIGK